MTEIVITVDERAKTTLELALQNSREDLNTVFETFIYEYAERVLNTVRNGETGSADVAASNTANDGEAGGGSAQSSLKPELPLKALKRLPLWASRSTTFIHQIISAYFAVERDREANLNDMYEKFKINNPLVSAFTFRNNIVALTSEKGNASGHLFELSNDKVTVYSPMSDELNARRNEFLTGVDNG